MVLLPAFTCEVPFMLRRGVRKDRRRDRDSLRCVPIRSDGASEEGRASQSAVGRFTSRTPSFHCSGGDAGENWNRCESPGGGSAYETRIRRRDQQNPVHREAVQGPFKEAHVDEERANNLGLTQEHVDRLVRSPCRARSCGTAATITLGVKRSCSLDKRRLLVVEEVLPPLGRNDLWQDHERNRATERSAAGSLRPVPRCTVAF